MNSYLSFEEHRLLSFHIQALCALKPTEIEDLDVRIRRVEHERFEAEAEVFNLKSQLAVRDSEIIDLRKIIEGHARAMVEEMQVAGIPF